MPDAIAGPQVASRRRLIVAWECRSAECAEFRVRLECHACAANAAAAGEHGRPAGGFPAFCRLSRCRRNAAADQRPPRFAARRDRIGDGGSSKQQQQCDRSRDAQSRLFGAQHRDWLDRDSWRCGECRFDSRLEIEVRGGESRACSHPLGGRLFGVIGQRRHRPHKFRNRCRIPASPGPRRSGRAAGLVCRGKYRSPVAGGQGRRCAQSDRPERRRDGHRRQASSRPIRQRNRWIRKGCRRRLYGSRSGAGKSTTSRDGAGRHHGGPTGRGAAGAQYRGRYTTGREGAHGDASAGNTRQSGRHRRHGRGARRQRRDGAQHPARNLRRRAGFADKFGPDGGLLDVRTAKRPRLRRATRRPAILRMHQRQTTPRSRRKASCKASHKRPALWPQH